jgi:hypothetical protein
MTSVSTLPALMVVLFNVVMGWRFTLRVLIAWWGNHVDRRNELDIGGRRSSKSRNVVRASQQYLF